MGTEANHRDKARKQIRRKAEAAAFALRGFLRKKQRNRTTALMIRQRKARPWTLSSLWLPLGCWSSAGTFSFFYVSPFTSQVTSPMASTSILYGGVPCRLPSALCKLCLPVAQAPGNMTPARGWIQVFPASLGAPSPSPEPRSHPSPPSLFPTSSSFCPFFSSLLPL